MNFHLYKKLTQQKCHLLTFKLNSLVDLVIHEKITVMTTREGKISRNKRCVSDF